MSRRGAQQRQTKIVASSLGAIAALFLALVYTVTASGDSQVSRRASTADDSSRLLNERASNRAGGATLPKSVALAEKLPTSSEILALAELVEDVPDAPIEEPSEAKKLFKDVDLMAGTDLGVRSRTGLTNGFQGRSTGVRSGRNRGQSAGSRSAFGAFGSGGGVSGGGVLPRETALETASLFEGLGSTDVDDLLAITETPLTDTPNTQFRRGAPLPEGFDPCRFGELVVSPCVMSSTAILEELAFAPADVPPVVTRVVFFESPPPGNGGSSGNGGFNGGSNGGSNGGANGGESGNGGSNGGESYPGDFSEESTPVPAPAPIFLLGFGLAVLIRRSRLS